MLYNRDKVRRPIPEEKAISRAVEMIRVTFMPTQAYEHSDTAAMRMSWHGHTQQEAAGRDQSMCSLVIAEGPDASHTFLALHGGLSGDQQTHVNAWCRHASILCW